MDKDHCISRLGFLKGASFAAFAGVAGRAVAADNGGVDAAQTGEAQLSQRPWLSTDVLVVGGGPAGVCAAIAAARNGAKVLVVEQSGMLGGMATQGLVGPFMTCYDKAGEKMIIRGLFEEIVDRLVARGGALHPKGVFGNGPYSAWIPKGHDHVTPFDPGYPIGALWRKALKTCFLRVGAFPASLLRPERCA